MVLPMLSSIPHVIEAERMYSQRTQMQPLPKARHTFTSIA